MDIAHDTSGKSLTLHNNMPHCLSRLQVRAQEQIQRLRALRNTPQSPAVSSLHDGNSSVHTRGFDSRDVQAPAHGHVHWQAAAVEAARLPTKAELHGTVGTVSRKVPYTPHPYFISTSVLYSQQVLDCTVTHCMDTGLHAHVWHANRLATKLGSSRSSCAGVRGAMHLNHT